MPSHPCTILTRSDSLRSLSCGFRWGQVLLHKSVCATPCGRLGNCVCNILALWAFSCCEEDCAPLHFVRGCESPRFKQLNKETTMSTVKANDFDFNQFNQLTERKPAGLQIFLAQQLLSNALWSMEKFDNPRSDAVHGVVTEIKQLRELMKQDAIARSAATTV